MSIKNMDYNIIAEDYRKILGTEYQYIIRDSKKMKESTCSVLYSNDRLYKATIERIIPKSGHLVLGFPKGHVPRLKNQIQMTMIKKVAWDLYGENVNDWNISLENILKPENGFSGITSEVTPIYYTKSDNEFLAFVACTSINVVFYEKVQRLLSQGKHPKVLLYEQDPPVEFLKNMNDYIKMCTDDEFLSIRDTIPYEEWKPEVLSYNADDEHAISNRIIQTLEDENRCVLQGPPGTGKSFTIANVIAKYLKDGKSVCATTMANKGLTELVLQEPLSFFLKEGRISKTVLTSEEQKACNGLKNYSEAISPQKGELLCSTFYKLSSVYQTNNIENHGIPQFDLIIIEEASQALLCTLSAFVKLGKRYLIVGDPMQLPPILTANDSRFESWGVNHLLAGLEKFALGTNIKGYRISTTFRLTEKSAGQTSVFYNGDLRSVKTIYKDFSKINNVLFPQEGGSIYHVTSYANDQYHSDEAIDIIRDVIDKLEKEYPKTKLAIVSPFVMTVVILQKNFENDKRKIDLTIDTIDRIQGMTVDYAIVYFPKRNPGFALLPNRFNVATSRSESTTLIISDQELLRTRSCVGYTRQFLLKCKRF